MLLKRNERIFKKAICLAEDLKCNAQDYQSSADLAVPNFLSGPVLLSSEEGCTQVDVLAMSKYAVGVTPLVKKLAQCTRCNQTWYADDSHAMGRLKAIKKWWNTITELGPKYGYYPKPPKTVLVVKNPQLSQEAAMLFRDTGVPWR